MLLTVKVSIENEKMLKLAYDRWYSDVKTITVENNDGTRSMQEVPNEDTPQIYLQKIYKDLVVSDIVNTIIDYKWRVDEEYDAEFEKEIREEIELAVSVTIK
jgi:hypothetical protein